MKIDILAIVAHPDDAELGCSGTLLKHKTLGLKTGVVDLTEGQLGSRGSAEIRLKEALDAGEVLKLDVRLNLGFEDGFFQNDPNHQLEIIKVIRHLKPDIVLTNAVNDRHPDHGRASKLVSDACFYSGLVRIETDYEGNNQDAWRPQVVYHFIQDRYIKPDLVVDVSGYVDQKMESIKAFKSQFYNPESPEPETPISSKEFLDHVVGRLRDHGRLIGVEYGEGFTTERALGVHDLSKML